MPWEITLRGQTFSFAGLYDVMAKANEEKSGDQLAGVAAGSALERVAAKMLLADVTLETIYENPAVPYETDEVTRVIVDDMDLDVYRQIKGWTVSDLREYLLRERNENVEIQTLSRGLSSEMIAAAAKLMSNMDLILAARKIRIEATCRTTIGSEGVFASRLQPNHPTDSVEGILASTREGLTYGVGDAVIGINPVDDRWENIARIMNRVYEFTHEQWEIPTQTCVLAHVTTQMKALENGAKTDLIFQSLAGTQKGNQSFGIEMKMLEEAQAAAQGTFAAKGPNRMYFETGQGSELSGEAHEGIDQLTLEARCYGLARHFRPFLVNSVVGFIGPEYLYDGKQITRAGLEDHFMGKLSGLPMGLDVCYTNHSQADQNDLENMAVLLAAAGANFFMGVPMGDDVMLSYQTTSFHDIASLRQILGLRPIAEFERWLEERGFYANGRLTEKAGDATLLCA